MTRQSWYSLGLAASLLLGMGCHSCNDGCGERRGLFGWRERARERELARERNRDLDPNRPRLDEPIPPNSRDSIPPPEIPSCPRASYRVNSDIGPSPGSWVGPLDIRKPKQDLPPWPSELPSKSRSNEKRVLEADPLPNGLNAPPPTLDFPSETRSSSGGIGLEAPIRPQTMPSKAEAPASIPPLPKLERPTEKTTSLTLEEPIRPDFAGSTEALPGLFIVPGFKDVYTGRKPALEGFERLKTNGVRTVLYLHSPKADLSAPRMLAEKHGLGFEPIAVSPERLSESATRFRETVKDSSKRPVFVYDETGVRAGVLWYVFFREEQHSPDVAKVRAGSLGLGNVITAEDNRLWNAAQNLTR